MKVWKSLPCSKIANSCVLAKRIAERIISPKGGNDFLSGVDGTVLSGIRADFVETEDGNVRRDGDYIPFESGKVNPMERVSKMEEKNLIQKVAFLFNCNKKDKLNLFSHFPHPPKTWWP